MFVKIARFSLVDLRCHSSDLNQIWFHCREKSLIDAIIMAALSRCGRYIFAMWFLLQSLFIFSSPNLSGHRVDIYHTH